MRANPTMIPRSFLVALTALALCSASAGADILTIVRSAASASDRDSRFNVRETADQFVVTAIQENLDLAENEFLTVFCGAFAGRDEAASAEGVQNVKASWSAKLLVINEGAGTLESVELGSGTFRTDGEGRASWRSTIETADFADGFPESTSAVVQNEVRFTKGKRVSSLHVHCGYP